MNRTLLTTSYLAAVLAALAAAIVTVAPAHAVTRVVPAATQVSVTLSGSPISAAVVPDKPVTIIHAGKSRTTIVPGGRVSFTPTPGQRLTLTLKGGCEVVIPLPNEKSVGATVQPRCGYVTATALMPTTGYRVGRGSIITAIPAAGARVCLATAKPVTINTTTAPAGARICLSTSSEAWTLPAATRSDVTLSATKLASLRR